MNKRNVLGVAALVVATSCGSGPSSTTPEVESVSSTAATTIVTGISTTLPPSSPPATGGVTEIPDNVVTPLTPGNQYRITGMLPAVLDVEFTSPPGSWQVNKLPSGLTAIGSTDGAPANSIAFFDVANQLSVTKTGFFRPQEIASPEDLAKVAIPAPSDLLGWLTNHPSLQVTKPPTDGVVAGRPAKVFEITTKKLPPEAPIFGGKPGMVLFMGPGHLTGIPEFDVQRVAIIETGVGDLMVWANPDKVNVDDVFGSIKLSPTIPVREKSLPVYRGRIQAGKTYHTATNNPVQFTPADDGLVVSEDPRWVIVENTEQRNIFLIAPTTRSTIRVYRDLAQPSDILDDVDEATAASSPFTTDLATTLRTNQGLEVLATGSLPNGEWVDVKAKQPPTPLEGCRVPCAAVLVIDGFTVVAPVGPVVRFALAGTGEKVDLIRATLATEGEAIFSSMKPVGT